MTKTDTTELHYQLIKLLSNCNSQEEFIDRLIYARDLIVAEIQTLGIIEKRQEI